MEEGSRRDPIDVDGDDRGRGAGGKLTKRSLRSSRVQSSPYARPPPPPPPAVAEKSKSGWLSKLLVKPVSKILPSLFSSSSSPSSSNQQDQVEEQGQDRERPLMEIEQEHASVCAPTSNNQFFEPKESGAPAETREPKVNSGGDGFVRYTGSDHGISDIEKRLQQKKFSRDETDHLIELLRSRTADLPDEDGHARRLKLETSVATLGQKDLRKSTKEDYGIPFDSTVMWKSSDQFQFTANGGSSSSPVEIAKAYMQARTSASGYDCQTGRLKNEKNSFSIDNPASKLSFTPIAKSPVCWPGAITQTDHGYVTPRRATIVRHLQSPYSGALLPKSTSKFQLNSERPNRSTAARSSTHAFGRNMTNTRMNPALDYSFAPVSPIHRTHQNDVATTSKGVGRSSLATSFSLLPKSDASSGFSSANGTDSSSESGFYKFQPANLDGTSRFAVDTTPVHPQSSVMARKILEHLDISVPSPKEKLLEIILARKRVPPESEVTNKDGQHGRSDVSVSKEQKAGCLLGRDVVSQEIVDAQKVLSGKLTSTFDNNDGLSSLPQTSKQVMLGLAQGTTASSAAFQIPEHVANSAMFQTTESLSHSSYETSIPTSKPSEKLKIHDNGFSFTFPVSVTLAPFSEPPPTPTMASFAATTRELETGEGSIPSFSFGSTKASDRLVFSFGSDISSSDLDTTTPSFKFGTENKSSLSFKPIGRDAICY